MYFFLALETDKLMKDYDFIQAPIDGFEAYSQYYVFEKNLQKLQPPEENEIEKVNWDEKKYDEFLKGWERTCC